MASTAIDLASLPAPTIVETLNFETILSERKASFQSLWQAVRASNPDLNLPEYDVSMLETDPVVVLLEEESYREIIMRARVNAAARSNFLAFATGAELEHLAGFYDVIRMVGELDDRLRERVVLAIQGRSPGGTKERYKFIAMTASIEVEGVEVYRAGKSPVVHVAIFSTAADGIASTALLATVTATLQSSDVIMVNDTISVESAVRIVVDIEADYFLDPSAPLSTNLTMEQNLRDTWAAVQALGRDLPTSWWVSKLMVSGVQSVIPLVPIETQVAPDYAAISLGTVKLNYKGRAF
ncbi:baseplate J/gp47 family protein [Neorhizobium sp. JUb45]|uniref:baseplate assembly protein n=1 Tax=Neorhizobium sp. JUb45 TaxID=2485113 RepID=UPI00104B6531|nr:baseplate J/gp47 family protein [Neorhizobium sp. JUb45]TCR07266.1 phage-related baseplate assembly protein [Neorhizobium sp. JUb45]